MKLFLILSLMVSSLSAFAQFNELECESLRNNQELYLEIPQPFPRNSTFKQMHLTVKTQGTERSFNYSVNSYRNPGFNRLQYIGSGARLEVDMWPDSYPRWGRMYQATLFSPELGSSQLVYLNCTFPNAQ